MTPPLNSFIWWVGYLVCCTVVAKITGILIQIWRKKNDLN